MLTRTMGRILLLTAGALMVGSAWLAYEAILANNAFDAPRIVTIPAGSRASAVADTLERTGVIRSRTMFLIALRVLGKAGELRPGQYELPAHASNRSIVLALSRPGSGRHAEVTFPEGITSMAMAHLAASRLGCDSARFELLVTDSLFIHALGLHARSLEGYLLPETYEFDLPVQEREVVGRMARAMDRFLDDSLRSRIAALGVTEAQALALASIVEGEAVADTERPRIAGVYWNRLRSHMRLEADPTIQYIIGTPRRLTYDDLQIQSPYNTYLHDGLPPTPINNPGRHSILATLNPEQNDYVYFVARGDGSGTHRFSRTIEEHQRAVAAYRKSRKRRA